MQQRGAVAVAVVVALASAALGVKTAVDAARPKGSDQQQIAQMLLDGQAAVERHDTGGVTRYISDDYHDNLGFSASSVKFQISDYLRRKRNVHLTIPEQSIQVNLNPDGQTGTVLFHVSASSAGESGATRSEMDVSLQVKKEPVHYYVFFPGQEWKVVGADGYAGLEGL